MQADEKDTPSCRKQMMQKSKKESPQAYRPPKHKRGQIGMKKLFAIYGQSGCAETQNHKTDDQQPC
jgi:hypothetical protein